jgi:hypothetical protein
MCWRGGYSRSRAAVCWKHRPARPRRRSPHVLDWFLRRADDIINRLADYLHATGRANTRSPGSDYAVEDGADVPLTRAAGAS